MNTTHAGHCVSMFALVAVLIFVSAPAHASAVGKIWGYKISQPDQSVTLDSATATTTANPYVFDNLSPGSHTVSVTIPAGWSVGYTLCYNNYSCHNDTPTAAPTGSVTVSVPDGGFADLWWHYTQSTSQPPPTAMIQGYKVTMPGLSTTAQPASNQTVQLDGGSPTTFNPYSFTGLQSGDHAVSVSVPSGWQVGYTLCYNSISCHGDNPVMSSTVKVSLPAGGYADLWWHYYQQSSTLRGVVQGQKLDKFGRLFTNPGATITADGESFGTSLTTYSKTVTGSTATLVSSVPDGYDVYYSICKNCIDHPAGSYVQGSSVTVDVPQDGYVDVHWRYATPKLDTSFTLPGSSTLKQIFKGTLFTEIQREHPNVYAPDVIYENGIYKMWYGGYGEDGVDRVHYAESADGTYWNKKGVVLETPRSIGSNVNDASLVKVNGTYYMYVSVSEPDGLDSIYLSISSDGKVWGALTKVLYRGAPGSWDSGIVSRPTVIHDNGTFKMWYDARKKEGDELIGPINIGYATSSDGVHWTKYPDPVFADYPANDVKKIGNVYIMLLTGAWLGTPVAVSTDGIHWDNRGTLIPPEAGDPTKILGHITPFLFIDPATNKPKTVYLGGGIPAGELGYERNAMYMYSLASGELEKLVPEINGSAGGGSSGGSSGGSGGSRSGPGNISFGAPLTTPIKPLVTASTSLQYFPAVATSTPCVVIARNLYKGIRGNDVLHLQRYLITQKLLVASGATGYFGPLTQSAVQQWQKSRGIVSAGTPGTTGYGVVGPKTRALLRVCPRD